MSNTLKEMTVREVIQEAMDLDVEMSDRIVMGKSSHLVVLLALRMLEKTLTETTRTELPENLAAVERLWDVIATELSRTLKECGQHGAD